MRDGHNFFEIIKDFRRLIILSLLTAAVLFSCDMDNGLSDYDGKNLIKHNFLSSDDWKTDQNTTYMTWEDVTYSTTAGTSGLPDETSLIYRLEINNLFLDGDFEATTAGTLPGNWDAAGIGGGTCSVIASGHPLDGNALSFDLGNAEYVQYPLNYLVDGALVNSSYVFRFDISGNITGAYFFEVHDTTSTETDVNRQWKPSISITNTAYAMPDDFTGEISATDFTIGSNDSDVFRINFDTDGTTQQGYIDNLRFVKSDQEQFLTISIPYADSARVDSLNLASGTYRFGIYVKADPDAGSGNRFSAEAVTLKLASLDEKGLTDITKTESFPASAYNNFTSWTLIYTESSLQIDAPANTGTAVIMLSISPCDTTGGDITIDAGSILISNPQLLYSSSGSF